MSRTYDNTRDAIIQCINILGFSNEEMRLKFIIECYHYVGTTYSFAGEDLKTCFIDEYRKKHAVNCVKLATH